MEFILCTDIIFPIGNILDEMDLIWIYYSLSGIKNILFLKFNVLILHTIDIS